MKIKIATIDDVPELLSLQYKAFRPVAESLNWPDAPNLTETPFATHRNKSSVFTSR